MKYKYNVNVYIFLLEKFQMYRIIGNLACIEIYILEESISDIYQASEPACRRPAVFGVVLKGDQEIADDQRHRIVEASWRVVARGKKTAHRSGMRKIVKANKTW